MERDQFWALIEETRDEETRDDNDRAVRLLGRLQELPSRRTSMASTPAAGEPSRLKEWVEAALCGKACCRHAARLAVRLCELPPSQIVAFGRIHQQLRADAYRWDLWGAAYLIQAGCSDDGFADFQGWLIGQGRRVFEAALRDPDRLAEHPQVQAVTAASRWALRTGCEFLLYVASPAYQHLTGQELPLEVDEGETERFRRGPVGDDWDFDDDEQMRRRFPRLWATVGWDKFR